MSEQENTQEATKLRRSRRIQKQDGAQPLSLSLPPNDDKEAWKAYWQALGQPWRTEPVIEMERQKHLDVRRSIKPDIEKGIYPFKDEKLSRADVEWLLATHENGRGPVVWSDENHCQHQGLDLRGADLSHVNLSYLPLTCLRGGLSWAEWLLAKEQHTKAAMLLDGVNLMGAKLERANLCEAQLIGANLSMTRLNEAVLSGAQLERTDFRWAQLEGADLSWAQLEGADFTEAQFKGADLRGIILSDEKRTGPLLVDVQWTEVNLAIVDWSHGMILGDEHKARQEKNKKKQLEKYQQAVRANRQLAIVLQTQGLNEDAARFSYRAQVLQRKVFWMQKKFGQYLFSLFLALLAGYGYKPWRAFLAYLLVITVFGIAYFALSQTVGPVLSPLGSFVFSMTSFHGRGFFPGGIALDDPLTVLAALEAFVGLLIEVTFIATLTQRLFSK